MDPFTQRMLERAKQRRERLDGHMSKQKQPLQENKSDNVMLSDRPGARITEKGKSKLDRLGELYSHPGQLSSPVHSSQDHFDQEETQAKPSKKLGRLAELASTIQQWEDDLGHPRWSGSAQEEKQPENTRPGSSSTDSLKTKAEVVKCIRKPETVPQVSATEKTDAPKEKSSKQVAWDNALLTTLESQGYSRSQCQTKLVYEFGANRSPKMSSPHNSASKLPSTPYSKVSPGKWTKEKTPNSPGKWTNKDTTTNNSPKKWEANRDKTNDSPSKWARLEETAAKKSPRMGVGALKDTAVWKKAAMFESVIQKSPGLVAKDPAELSLSERKAMFEKNRGEALLPKVAFATSLPANLIPQPKAFAAASTPKIAMTEAPVKVVPGVLAQREVFEMGGVETTNDNLSKLERQKEMELLRNRWNHRKQTSQEPPVKTLPPQAIPPPPPMPPSQEAKFRDSPDILKSVKDVKKIKVSPLKDGRLYPSLKDLEVSDSDNSDSSVALTNSINSDHGSSDMYLNMSFGEILEASKNNPVTPPSTVRECHLVLNEMDELLDEALGDASSEDIDDEGPTPPKVLRASSSFVYQNRDDGTPLMHTVSFYRKQQNTSQNQTPPMRITREVEKEDASESQSGVTVEEKVEALLQEISKQQTIISQASQALSLCLSTVEFSGSGEQVEGERLLLLASQKRQACLNELQRLRVEGLRPPHADQLTEQGDLVISAIGVPLKRDALRSLAARESMLHLTCLVKSDDKVLATPVVSAVRAHLDGNCLVFPGTVKLLDLYSDFKVTVEVYSMELGKEMLPHDVKYHISNKKEKKLLTPLKKKTESKLMMPSIQSPAGPNAVRTTNFQLCGYVVFSLREVTRTQWTLNKVPYTSPLEGSLHMKVTSELKLDSEFRGFLTMFDDISGLGAWHRRWCLLSSHTLTYWKYPDDEGRKVPMGSIDLRGVVTETVGLVSRDICARLNTVLLETIRPRTPEDKDSLVMILERDTTRIRHLLSADTKEDRLEWSAKLNKALALLRAWNCQNSL